MRWAVVAPTFPAPMTVTLLRAMLSLLLACLCAARARRAVRRRARVRSMG
jgi:hypothetical protein